MYWVRDGGGSVLAFCSNCLVTCLVVCGWCVVLGVLYWCVWFWVL